MILKIDGKIIDILNPKQRKKGCGGRGVLFSFVFGVFFFCRGVFELLHWGKQLE